MVPSATRITVEPNVCCFADYPVFCSPDSMTDELEKPMRINKLTVITLACAALLYGCGQSAPEAPAEAEEPMAAPEPAPPPEPAPEPVPMEAEPMDLASLLASDARSEEDRARDAGRKPAEVLALLGIEPGMDVLDLVAASGWYSEVLSLAVGPDGSVTAQNPAWMLAFQDGGVVAGLDARIEGGLSNVTRLDSSWAELGAMETRFDAALSALNIHDVYYLESPEATAEFAGAVYNVLKPGGVFGIVEHVGDPDGENANLHRIDKDLVIDIVTDAGFVVEADSDLLANPADDHTQSVFSEGIRGQTDRFLLKLRKPE
jgi:predicted methyltransferase